MVTTRLLPSSFLYPQSSSAAPRRVQSAGRQFEHFQLHAGLAVELVHLRREGEHQISRPAMIRLPAPHQTASMRGRGHPSPTFSRAACPRRCAGADADGRGCARRIAPADSPAPSDADRSSSSKPVRVISSRPTSRVESQRRLQDPPVSTVAAREFVQALAKGVQVLRRMLKPAAIA